MKLFEKIFGAPKPEDSTDQAEEAAVDETRFSPVEAPPDVSSEVQKLLGQVAAEGVDSSEQAALEETRQAWERTAASDTDAEAHHVSQSPEVPPQGGGPTA